MVTKYKMLVVVIIKTLHCLVCVDSLKRDPAMVLQVMVIQVMVIQCRTIQVVNVNHVTEPCYYDTSYNETVDCRCSKSLRKSHHLCALASGFFYCDMVSYDGSGDNGHCKDDMILGMGAECAKLVSCAKYIKIEL